MEPKTLPGGTAEASFLLPDLGEGLTEAQTVSSSKGTSERRSTTSRS
jgi:hypothetical protein